MKSVGLVWVIELQVLLVLVHTSHSVQRAPRIITLLETMDILLGHNATFICEVESRPPADITWTKNNQPIMYYDPRYRTREQGQMLIIPHVRESDNGEYCCIANNGIGEGAKSCGALQLKMKPQIKRHPSNLTQLLGSKAVLPCVTLGNPRPDVTWLKDDEMIKISDRVTILDYGTLKIHNVQKEDAGQYRCVARNSLGLTFSRPVTMEVQAPARILQVPKEKRVAFGSQVTLECNATGNPVPTITWLENGNTLSGAAVEETLVGEAVLSVLRVTVNKPALYTCLASNRHSAGANTVKATARVTVTEWRLYKGVAGYCSAYRGDVCRTVLPDHSLVFFNSSLSEDTQEDQVQSWSTDLDGLGPLCAPALRSLLCHHSFPDCNPSGLGPAPKPVCREHCLAVKELYCQKEWLALLQSGLFSSVTGSSAPSSPLPNCQVLPSLGPEPEVCTHVPFVDVKKDHVTTSCYNDRGRFYQGGVNVTSSGTSCQPWAQQVHAHNTVLCTYLQYAVYEDFKYELFQIHLITCIHPTHPAGGDKLNSSRGGCAGGKPMCLMFEYMAHGDLNEFLRRRSPAQSVHTLSSASLSGRSFTSEAEAAPLSCTQMLSVSKQIAAGMAYLSERKFVHRDLATRNCLVGEEMVVKIADFGLSRNIYSADYYKANENDAIPIRWMPPESIFYNRYTSESDVWAYGVVLWEIFSHGMQPYYGMGHEEVIYYVRDGHILSCPDNCPLELYNLMRLCWSGQPSERPSFSSIHRILERMHQNTERVDTGPEVSC
ncbi:muscle, skeletal receptor tyrosine-protein kinase [Cynoglossus semilaevis]|uniref:muscle, skeletal receptor tyrosine-protein kinase n=1 Tax=Cynoglossus semilaevis TaxID=244447 RepID=UPI000D62D380|nr:muscle, skeletal receptor tyrosine protein kinase-like [Cynoglossus semilaevis]